MFEYYLCEYFIIGAYFPDLKSVFLASCDAEDISRMTSLFAILKRELLSEPLEHDQPSSQNDSKGSKDEFFFFF